MQHNTYWSVRGKDIVRQAPKSPNIVIRALLRLKNMNMGLVQHAEGESSLRAREGRREEAVKHELIDVIPAVRARTPSDVNLMDAVMVDNGHGSRELSRSYVLASLTFVAEAKFEPDRFKIDSA